VYSGLEPESPDYAPDHEVDGLAAVPQALGQPSAR